MGGSQASSWVFRVKAIDAGRSSFAARQNACRRMVGGRNSRDTDVPDSRVKFSAAACLPAGHPDMDVSQLREVIEACTRVAEEHRPGPLAWPPSKQANS